VQRYDFFQKWQDDGLLFFYLFTILTFAAAPQWRSSAAARHRVISIFAWAAAWL